MTDRQAVIKDERKGPLVLALDTSTAALAAAVVRGTETLGSLQTMAERNHSVQTVPQIKALLEACGVAPEALDGLAIGRGPGSYTGMRIAVSVGKTLAWVWDKPLVGVSSLEALAYGAMRETETADASEMAGGLSGTDWFVPLMDARRGQVYTAAFASRAGGKGWTRMENDGVRLMKDWVERLNELRRETLRSGESPERLWIVGDLSLHETEATRLQALCEAEAAAAGGQGTEVRLFPSVMDGRAVAALGAQRLSRGESDDAHAFVPNYTQLVEAEVKLLAKQAEQLREAGGE